MPNNRFDAYDTNVSKCSAYKVPKWQGNQHSMMEMMMAAQDEEIASGSE